MQVIAQNINIFNPLVYDAIGNRDGVLIRDMVERMLDNGAHGIEINLGGWQVSDNVMPWLVKQVREVSDCPIFLSPIPSSLKEAVEAGSGGEIFINCVTADLKRLASMLNAARCLDTGLVVLLTRRGFCPATLDEVVLLAEEVIEKAEDMGFALERLVLDPVCRPRPTVLADGRMVNMPDVTFLAEALMLVGMLRQRKMATSAGIGNLMIGMDESRRKTFMRSVFGLLLSAGLDYFIMDCSNSMLVDELHSWKDDSLSSIVDDFLSVPHHAADCAQV